MTNLLSIIIPGFNTRQDWWVRCVRSVALAGARVGVGDRCRCRAERDDPFVEIICVDDGSKEAVREDWFEPCPEGVTIQVVRLEKNSGLPTARNRGLEVATGEFVTFVDSDDEVCAETYVKCLEALEKHGADVAVFGVNGLYMNDGFQVHDVPEDKFYGALRPEDVGFLVKKRLFYYSWNKVFRRAFLDQRGFRFYPEGVPCEDAIFNVGLVTQGAKWVTVAYEGYKYYRYDGSLLSTYKPTYMAGTRACTKAWRDYKVSTPGAVEGLEKYGLGWYDETSDADIIRGEWTNIWRRRSPYGLRARWRFAAEHKSELGRCTLLVFLKKAICMWARRHLYFKPIRRRHSIRFLTRIGAKVEPL